jgi:hypothetical protein
MEAENGKYTKREVPMPPPPPPVEVIVTSTTTSGVCVVPKMRVHNRRSSWSNGKAMVNLWRSRKQLLQDMQPKVLSDINADQQKGTGQGGSKEVCKHTAWHQDKEGFKAADCILDSIDSIESSCSTPACSCNSTSHMHTRVFPQTNAMRQSFWEGRV